MSVLSKRAASIQPSVTMAVTSRAKQLKAEGVDVVPFSAGEPDFGTPEYICKAGIEAIENGATRYTPASGTMELKTAIADKLKKDNNLEYTPAQIIVSCGAKHSLANIILTVVDDNDEVLLPAPYWVSYPEMVSLAGGITVPMPTSSEDGFKITPEQLKAAITPKTKMLILNSPSNPTGSVYTREELAALGEVLVGTDIIILSDEIYEKLVYVDTGHESIADVVPALKEQTVVVNGHSKSYAMTGWRIGYAAGPLEIIKAAGNIQSNTTSNPTSISQLAALKALSSEGDEFLAGVAKEFASRRDLTVELLRNLDGVKLPVAPQGAFYAFPDVSGLFGKGAFKDVKDSLGFATTCLEEKAVALVPGIAFGEDKCVRVSYATSIERIKEGIARIAELASL